MKYSASVDLLLRIDYDDIEADSEEEAERLAIDLAYQDVDFNNCCCEDTASVFVYINDNVKGE